jgi:LPPG:FO 2-phospho-L-lactate transferase
VKVAALAGGVGAGKFLRGLVRVVPARDVTVVVNTGDDIDLYGLRICPDLDSVTYWLAGAADRERGWGRADESFRALEEMRRLGGPAWFGLGDLDLAVHLLRRHWLEEGATLTDATERARRGFGIDAALLPMSDAPVRTWIETVSGDGVGNEEPFQTWWVAHGGRGEVKGVRFEGAHDAVPAPGVLEAIAEADAVLLCPSNPVVSLGPILALPAIRGAVTVRRDHVVGISPIVAGAPLRGMADRLMSAAGLEVSAHGAARAYRGLLGGWVLDHLDAGLAAAIREDLGCRVTATDTIMTDDRAAARLARVALDLAMA